MKNNIAPKGKIWLCEACGKVNDDLYGGTSVLWDVACTLNAILVDKNDLVQNADGSYYTLVDREKI